MKLSEEIIGIIKDAARALTGFKRRKFQAKESSKNNFALLQLSS